MPLSVVAGGSNVGSDSSSPYTLSVSIPAAPPGASTDWVVVVASWWAPRQVDGFGGGGGPLVSFLGAAAAGLTDWTNDGVSSDGIVGNQGMGMRSWLARRSDFTGGSITITASPTTATPSHLMMSVTTFLVTGDYAIPADPRIGGGQYSGQSYVPPSNNVGTTGDLDVVFIGDFYGGGTITPTSAGSYSGVMSRNLAVAGVNNHRVALYQGLNAATRVNFTGAVAAETVIGLRFDPATPPPPTTRRRGRGFGLVR